MKERSHAVRSQLNHLKEVSVNRRLGAPEKTERGRDGGGEKGGEKYKIISVNVTKPTLKEEKRKDATGKAAGKIVGLCEVGGVGTHKGTPHGF